MLDDSDQFLRVQKKSTMTFSDKVTLHLVSTVAKQYPNFMAHMEGYWKHRNDWAICFKSGETMRGINTNNYAESGIRILKDIVFN